MSQIAAMPSTAWYNPGNFGLPPLPDLTVNVQSPQAPANPTMDKVQLTINAVYGGRVAAVAGVNSLEQRENIRLKNLHNSGVMTTAAMSAAGKSALVAGGISVLRNMVDLAQGDVNVARATGNVSADIASGAVGGLAAGAAAGLVIQGVSNAGRALAGGLGTVVGIAAYAGADYLFNSIGLKGLISDKVTSILEGVNDSALPFSLTSAQQQGVAPAAYNPYMGQ